MGDKGLSLHYVDNINPMALTIRRHSHHILFPGSSSVKVMENVIPEPRRSDGQLFLYRYQGIPEMLSHYYQPYLPALPVLIFQ